MQLNDIFHDINNKMPIFCRTNSLKYLGFFSVHNIIYDIYDIINGIIDIINNINDNFAISQTAYLLYFSNLHLSPTQYNVSANHANWLCFKMLIDCKRILCYDPSFFQ